MFHVVKLWGPANPENQNFCTLAQRVQNCEQVVSEQDYSHHNVGMLVCPRPPPPHAHRNVLPMWNGSSSTPVAPQPACESTFSSVLQRVWWSLQETLAKIFAMPSLVLSMRPPELGTLTLTSHPTAIIPKKWAWPCHGVDKGLFTQWGQCVSHFSPCPRDREKT